jgi:hypothetical protein
MLLTPPGFDREVVAGACWTDAATEKDDVSFLEVIFVGVQKPVNHQA